MKKMILTAVCILGIYAASQAQETQKLKVNVPNVSSTEGVVIVSLFNSEETFLKDAYKEVNEKAVSGEMKFSFEDIPVGEYTICVIHDLNKNGELDRNFIGMPTEPYGISMQGKNSYSPPTYSKAIFKVEKRDHTITVKL